MPRAGMNPRINGIAGMRYCRAMAGEQAMNWHGAELTEGRMYRCCCMPMFRLPGGKFGPNSGMLKRVGVADRKRYAKRHSIRY